MEANEQLLREVLADLKYAEECAIDQGLYITELRRSINRIAVHLKAAEQKPVATVRVGQHDHGPFTFKETPYGADTLLDGMHDLYIAPVAPTQPEAAEPVSPAVEKAMAHFRKRAAEVDAQRAAPVAARPTDLAGREYVDSITTTGTSPVAAQPDALALCRKLQTIVDSTFDWLSDDAREVIGHAIAALRRQAP